MNGFGRGFRPGSIVALWLAAAPLAGCTADEQPPTDPNVARSDDSLSETWYDRIEDDPMMCYESFPAAFCDRLLAAINNMRANTDNEECDQLGGYLVDNFTNIYSMPRDAWPEDTSHLDPDAECYSAWNPDHLEWSVTCDPDVQGHDDPTLVELFTHEASHSPETFNTYDDETNDGQIGFRTAQYFGSMCRAEYGG